MGLEDDQVVGHCRGHMVRLTLASSKVEIWLHAFQIVQVQESSTFKGGAWIDHIKGECTVAETPRVVIARMMQARLRIDDPASMIGGAMSLLGSSMLGSSHLGSLLRPPQHPTAPTPSPAPRPVAPPGVPPSKPKKGKG